MKAKARNKDSMPSKVGKTYRFYLPNNLYDQLVHEAASEDISISALLREKLQILDKIKFLILKNNGGDLKN